MRRATALILLLMMAGALSCDRTDKKRERVFRFINRGDIFTLDLNQMSYAQDFRLTYAIREGLYGATGPAFGPEPAGATGYELSPDGKTYTFHLRHDAKWSNGDPVVAGDYAFSWKLLLDSPAEYAYLLYPIHNAEKYQRKDVTAFDDVGISVLDDHTLRVLLDRPVPYFLDLMTFPTFFPRHAKSMEPFRTSKDGERLAYRNQYTRPPAVVTNGPFKLVDWQFKEVLRLERNPYYYDADKIQPDAVENIVNDNALSQMLQFDAGAVDWICEVPPDLAADLRTTGRSDLQNCTAFGTAFLTLCCKAQLDPQVYAGANPLADARVRQALAMAIDKKFITEKITRNGEAVATQYVPPGTLPGYSSPPGLAFDVAGAKKLLAEAGYPDGRGFPQLPLLYNTENTVRRAFAQNLGRQWRENLGIDIRIEGLEGKIFHERVSKHQYAIATVAWFGDYPDVSTFTDKYLSTSDQNDSEWLNPKYDAMLAAATNEADPEKRLAILSRAETLLNTEVPIIPLYHYVNSTLIASHVRGIEVNPRSLVNWKRVSVGAGR